MTTTAFGVGADFDETLLRRMAEAGGGNFEFIASAVQIADFVASEVGEALAITAREAVLVVEAGEGATVESLNDFPCRRDGDAWRVEVGPLFSGQSFHPVLRLTFPGGEAGRTRDVTVRREDADGALGKGERQRDVHLGEPRGERPPAPRPRGGPPRGRALRGTAERDALERNRARDFATARAIVERCLEHIRRYAGDDPEIQAIAESLREKAARYGRDMDSLTRKSLHYTSSRHLKERLLEEERRHRNAPARVALLAAPGLARVLNVAIEHLAAADPNLFGNLALEETLSPAPRRTSPGRSCPPRTRRVSSPKPRRARPECASS